jgi:hypothetical protein
MEQAIHDIKSAPDTVEILVHITESLTEPQRGDLVAALENDNDIVSAEFCPLHFHLMLVRYDRDAYTSQDVLARVKSQNVNARLIGPI